MLVLAPFIKTKEEYKEVGIITKGMMKDMIDQTPNTYLFKTHESLIIRFRPGYSSDTRFATKEEVLANQE